MQIGSNVSDDLVQLTTLVISVIGIFLWARWGRGRAGYTVAPISYLAHRAIFYIVLIIHPTIDPDTMAVWAASLSLHSVITLTVPLLIFILIHRHRIS